MSSAFEARTLACVAGAFLAGSVPFGVLLTRHLVGVDVRHQGSGNIGATNVARVAGRKLGLWVLFLDALKGAVPTFLVWELCPADERLHVLVAYAAILGHVFTPWLRLKGGKGVATALGTLLVLEPWAALGAGAVYGLVFWRMRVSSIGSLAGALTAVTIAFLVPGRRLYAFFVLGVMLLLLWTHRSNLRRLWRRRERKL